MRVPLAFVKEAAVRRRSTANELVAHVTRTDAIGAVNLLSAFVSFSHDGNSTQLAPSVLASLPSLWRSRRSGSRMRAGSRVHTNLRRLPFRVSTNPRGQPSRREVLQHP